MPPTTPPSRSGGSTLSSLESPPIPIAELPPEQLEQYIIAGIHQDRQPGTVLVVLHPRKRIKLPPDLLDGLAERGFTVVVQETKADERESVLGIRDALRSAAAPLDVIVVGGDGSLDHHFLLAAAAAFYPEHVTEQPGRIAADVTAADLARLPRRWVSALGLDQPLPELTPTTAQVREVWVMRSTIAEGIRRRWSSRRLLARLGAFAEDPLVRAAVLATVAPDRVVVQAPGLDLSGLAAASQEETFRGFYPWIRSVTAYPAGTAADNAVFAGVPGLLLGLTAQRFSGLPLLGRPLLRWLQRRTCAAFLDFFCENSTVVPTRISLISMDDRWQRIGSHAVGGPGSGRLFAGDLESKPRGVVGYVMRLLPAIWREAINSTTQVHVTVRDSRGQPCAEARGGTAEALYTNRTFIAALGSVPTTTPTSFAGESSLVMLPGLVSQRPDGPRDVSLVGLAALIEAATKGITARLLHLVGLSTGRLAGDGRLTSLPPQRQVSLKEGAEVSVRFTDPAGHSRAVPVQISGDPYQASRMRMKVMWGPLPMLAANGSLLHASAQRTLSELRLQGAYKLEATRIGSVRHFWYRTGAMERDEIGQRTGLLAPPLHLPAALRIAGAGLSARWSALGVGPFVDTSAPGLRLRRPQVRLHNNDQTAHVLLLREGRSRLLVRLVRQDGEQIAEVRARYRRQPGAWIIVESQVMHWSADRTARLVYEERFFRDAGQFQGAAPAFFPLLRQQPDQPVLPPSWSDDDEG